MKEKALSYLYELHKDNTNCTHELVSLEIKLDTIPEYLNDAIFENPHGISPANKGALAIKFIKDFNSPDARFREQMTGEPYFWIGSNGRYYIENAYEDLDHLKFKLDSIKRKTTPAVAYVAYIVENFKFDTFEKEGKEIIVFEKEDPTKILKYYNFYGLGEDEMEAIKVVQLDGNIKRDTFGKVNTDGWYNIEKFILSDRLK